MIRQLQSGEEDAVALIWYRAGKAEYTYLPDFQALTEQDAKQIFRAVILSECEIWVETQGSSIRGFMALNGSYIDRLYVDPQYQRMGVGADLLAHAKQLHPSGIELRTHQQNRGARAMYEHFDFKAAEFGISPPPESVPDVLYQWLPNS